MDTTRPTGPFLPLPALKPNQPNHSKAVPRATNGTLWGRSWSLRDSGAGHARSKPRTGPLPGTNTSSTSSFLNPISEFPMKRAPECSRPKKGDRHRLPMCTPHKSSIMFRFRRRALTNSVRDSLPTPHHATPPNHPMKSLLSSSSSSATSRLPTTIKLARAEKPAVMWTTMPPAKSQTPHCANQPPPQIQWHHGA